MRTYTGIPTVTDSQATSSNGISQVVLNMARHLPAFGWQYSQTGGELRVHHAGEGGGETDIAICHGLHPTGVPTIKTHPDHWRINKRVIDDIKAAKAVVVPSEWVAEIMRREFHIEPHIIHWGINLEDWRHEEQHAGYVLWNKNRSDPVCNPHWLNEVAKITPDIGFITTFGAQQGNVKIIGRQPKQTMAEYIKHAGVYLATTKETGDIGSREALAAGVPVVAFAQGGVLDFVQQGVNGVLVPVGDVQGLSEGIRYALRHRETLSANAKALAASYGWETSIAEVARIFDGVANETPSEIKISVVIPCFNYGAHIREAVDGALAANRDDVEIIIVDDASDDAGILHAALRDVAFGFRVRVIRHEQNRGVAEARNTGIKAANGRLILCLDADDAIDPKLLTILSNALDSDPQLGIAYSALKIMGMDGVSPWPPPNFDLDGQLQHNNQIPTCAMFRRADFYRVGGYRSYMQPAEDADFFTRLLIYTGKTAKRVTDAPLFHYRVHEESLSRTLKIDPYRQRPTITAYKTRTLALPTPKDFPHASNPVRHYDAPLVAVVIEGSNAQEIYATLDSLENQTLSQWVAFVEAEPPWRGAPFVKVGGNAEAQQAAPFQLNIKSGTILEAGYLQTAFTEGSLMSTCCGGSVKLMNLDRMTDENSVLIEYLSPMTGKHPVTGSATRHNYHMHRSGDRFEVFRADAEAQPERFRIITEEPLAVVIPAVEPLPPAPVALVHEFNPRGEIVELTGEPIVTVDDAPPQVIEVNNITWSGEPITVETSSPIKVHPATEPQLHAIPTYTQEPISPQALKEIIEAQRDEVGRSLDETSLDVLKPDAGFVKKPAQSRKRTPKNKGKRTG